jgi:DNA-binding transcriptional MerR regulator
MNHPVMTIGDLAHRTGVAVKVLRRQQNMGLIYTRGRSPAGYRLFDEDALRCVHVVRGLRDLGLTEAQIAHLAACCDDNPALVGPPLAALLTRAHARIDARIHQLERQRRRIDAFQRRHHDALSGRDAFRTPDPWGSTRPNRPAPLDSPTGGTPEAGSVITAPTDRDST